MSAWMPWMPYLAVWSTTVANGKRVGRQGCKVFAACLFFSTLPVIARPEIVSLFASLVVGVFHGATFWKRVPGTPVESVIFCTALPARTCNDACWPWRAICTPPRFFPIDPVLPDPSNRQMLGPLCRPVGHGSFVQVW